MPALWDANATCSICKCASRRGTVSIQVVTRWASGTSVEWPIPGLEGDKLVSASNYVEGLRCARVLPIHDQNPDAQLFCDGMHPDTQIARCEHSRDEEDRRTVSPIFTLLRCASDVRVTDLQLSMRYRGRQYEPTMESILCKVLRSSRRWRLTGGLCAYLWHRAGSESMKQVLKSEVLMSLDCLRNIARSRQPKYE